MNIREYILTNSEPILKNERNIFVLLWLERVGYATAESISKSTNIPLKYVNSILQILYKNNLASFEEDIYKITKQGIELLDSLGYSDMYIRELLSQTYFIETEYELYKNMLSTYREKFLDTYLIIVWILKSSDKELFDKYRIMNLNRINEKEFKTLLCVNIFHDLSNVLYTNENTSLFSSYNRLYNHCWDHYCYSSEKYHYEASSIWKRSKVRDETNDYISGKLKKIFSKYLVTYFEKPLLEGKNTYTIDINKDLKLSNYTLRENNILLNSIFISKDIRELAKKIDLNENQVKFVLKSLQSKISELLE